MTTNDKSIMKATTTPLASIFGSGFLVVVPILKGGVGPYALLAMAVVCGIAYAVGDVVKSDGDLCYQAANAANSSGTSPLDDANITCFKVASKLSWQLDEG